MKVPGRQRISVKDSLEDCGSIVYHGSRDTRPWSLRVVGRRRPVRYTCPMTTRRRLLVFGPLASLLVLGMRSAWPRTAITRANAARVQKGMTLDQVEAILGGPAR